MGRERVTERERGGGTLCSFDHIITPLPECIIKLYIIKSLELWLRQRKRRKFQKKEKETASSELSHLCLTVNVIIFNNLCYTLVFRPEQCMESPCLLWNECELTTEGDDVTAVFMHKLACDCFLHDLLHLWSQTHRGIHACVSCPSSLSSC